MITIEQASLLVETIYGFKGSLEKLPGYEDLNFKLSTADGQIYTLKISQDNAHPDWIDLQVKVLRYLEKSLDFSIPFVHPTIDGQPYVEKQLEDGKAHFIRMQKWVPGQVLAKVKPHINTLLNQIGSVAGAFSRGLAGFEHPNAIKPFNWDIARLLDYEPFLTYIQDKNQKEIVTHFFSAFKHNLPIINKLRKSVCYNDLNDYNILTSWQKHELKITGIIDFGDVIYTQTVNELAIACAYACMHQKEPLSAAAEIVKGYHTAFPLEDQELEMLYFLIAARLVISVCNSAKNKKEEPNNEYLLISEKPAWNLLEKWRALSPSFAYYRFREACGLAPCPKESLFQQWLKQNKQNLIPPISISGKTVTWLDLSLDSLEFGHVSKFESLSKFEKTIARYLEDQNAQIGLGGYGEVRAFYSSDAYHVQGNQGTQSRTVHLGLDIWSPFGTSIISPLSGTIYATANHQQDRDYGGMVILKHVVSDELTFYTLYGHLAWSSIQHWKLNDLVKAGDKIAELGNKEENGQWPPHLHFQVMLDMLGWQDDFPGVAFHKEAAVWKSICPYIPFYPGHPANLETPIKEMITIRKKLLGKNLSLSYDDPIHMVRGYKQYLYDHTGKRFLDTVNNVAHVGHEHPRVVAAGQRQMAVLNTNTRYLHHNLLEYAEKLLATFPDELSVCYFVNSGSEANELALRMAKTFRAREDMIAVEVGYHGNTGNTIDISSYKFDQPGGLGKPNHTHVAPIPDTYRGIYRNTENAGILYAENIKTIIEDLKISRTPPAGFIAESIMSCGGQIELPPNYLSEVYTLIRNAGGVCIADEVQVGFGRVGSHFWGFELSGVVPDIVTLGKPIGNGHPLGAVICTQEIAEAFNNGMEYFNTYGGNPVSCAIGLEVLKVIEDEDLQQNALEIGNYIKQNLMELQNDYPIIGDVRGQGLFLGFELVRDHKTLEAADHEANYLVNRMRILGYLMSTDGPLHNVIKIKPPMCITKQDVDGWMEYLASVLSEDPMQV